LTPLVPTSIPRKNFMRLPLGGWAERSFEESELTTPPSPDVESESARRYYGEGCQIRGKGNSRRSDGGCCTPTRSVFFRGVMAFEETLSSRTHG